MHKFDIFMQKKMTTKSLNMCPQGFSESRLYLPKSCIWQYGLNPDTVRSYILKADAAWKKSNLHPL